MSSSEKLFIKMLFEISSKGISKDFLPTVKAKLIKDSIPLDSVCNILADIMCVVDEDNVGSEKDLLEKVETVNEKLIPLAGFLNLLSIDKKNNSVYNNIKSKIHYHVMKGNLKNYSISKKKLFRISELSEYVKIYLNDYDKLFEENLNTCYKSKSVIN